MEKTNSYMLVFIRMVYFKLNHFFPRCTRWCKVLYDVGSNGGKWW